MEFGASIFFTDYSITAGELAVALEERGFDSVWAAEHSHIPVPRRTPAPGGGELHKRYYDVMDPFITLTAAACATKKLKVATGIALVIQRDTIQTAKLVASIDQISGGRFLFGIGGGWNTEEIENHGTAFATRMQKMREQIEAMKAIWTEAKPEYHGRYGDGWYPNASSGNPEDYVPAFRKMAQEAGRDPKSLSLRLGGAPDDADKLKRFRDIGVDAVNVTLMSETRDQLLPVLDHWAGHIRQLRG